MITNNSLQDKVYSSFHFDRDRLKLNLKEKQDLENSKKKAATTSTEDTAKETTKNPEGPIEKVSTPGQDKVEPEIVTETDKVAKGPTTDCSSTTGAGEAEAETEKLNDESQNVVDESKTDTDTNNDMNEGNNEETNDGKNGESDQLIQTDSYFDDETPEQLDQY